MINKIQIKDTLINSKTCVMKWSANRESFPGKLQVNTKLSSNSLELIKKYQSIDVFQLYETWRGMNVIWYFTISSSLSI